MYGVSADAGNLIEDIWGLRELWETKHNFTRFRKTEKRMENVGGLKGDKSRIESFTKWGFFPPAVINDPCMNYITNVEKLF